MDIQNFKVVLFDFDGVIADTMEDNFNAWKKAYMDFGVQITKEDYFPLEGMRVIDVAKTLSQKYSLETNPQEIFELKKRYYLENNSFCFYEGVEKLIKDLRDSGKRLAIVTASPKSRLNKTVPDIFLEKFEAIVSGDDYENGKPNPEPYLKAMEKLNVFPEECLVVENAPLGIKSAKKAGAYCIALTTTLDKGYLSEADVIFNNHKELDNFCFKKGGLNKGSRKKYQVALADLTYTNQGISSSGFPYGISLIAAYAKKIFDKEIEIEIFKYPKEFNDYLIKNNPKIIGFSNFSWTLDLSIEFSKKIKEKFPESIIIFGGPNYPSEFDKQKKFLKSYPSIDFYIQGEAELAFVELIQNLEKFDFNIGKFKKNRIKSGNCRYLYNGEMISGDTLPRVENLDKLQSPYLMGILDKFFDSLLTPIIQTTRGCPFGCTYCQEGGVYFSKIGRYSLKRIKEDLEYLAKRSKVSNLMLIDSNFGMYKEDLETCKTLSYIKEKYKWPKHIEATLGKNADTVLQAILLLKEDIVLDVPVQSTNPIVLKNIKRQNVFSEKMIKIINSQKSFGTNSFSEVILCLPGDTKKAHFKSMFDLIDGGVNVVRSHQLLVLPGSEIANEESIKNFDMVTKFRLQPRCFGNYECCGEMIAACEIDELCIANKSMSYEDYLECRRLDMTVELFYNNGVFQELIRCLNQLKITTSLFIKNIHEKIPFSSLNKMYKDFIKENEDSLWDSKEELEKFMKQQGMIEHYIKNSLRNNEQLKYRAISFFTRMEELHEIAFNSAKELLKNKSQFNETIERYLDELYEFSLTRKRDLFSLGKSEVKKFHFDFINLSEKDFDSNPWRDFLSEELNIKFFHSEEQIKLIKRYLKQYGTSMDGLGFMLSRSRAEGYYRMVEVAN